jgi:DNA sulfur modification protein DndD
VLPNEESRCLELLSEEAEGQNRLLDADRVLARVPTPEVLESILDERKRLAISLTDILARKLSLDHELENTTKQLEKLEARVKEQLDSEFGNNIEDEETQRILRHSRRVRDTLQAFQGAVIRQNISRIEALVMDCLNQLLRKQSLVTRLHIDPNACSLELYGADNSVIRPERLSAGERQLLAVALLWGLGRAAGKPLPVVIDTPMGRLDSIHRQRLVEKYFPRASHQVLLLSTDEEIDAEQFHRLKPFISHVYRLDFDPAGSSTRVVQGYFGDKE